MSIPDRIERAFRALVESILSEKLYGIYPYAVTSFDEAAQTVDAAPLGGSSNLPPVAKLKIRTPKLQLKLAAGEQIAVAFGGGDPSQPFVVSFDYSGAYGSALAVARQGDMVMTTITLVPAVGPTGPIPGVYSITFAGPPPPAPFVPGVGGPAKFFGIVTSGSVLVKSQ